MKIGIVRYIFSDVSFSEFSIEENTEHSPMQLTYDQEYRMINNYIGKILKCIILFPKSGKKIFLLLLNGYVRRDKSISLLE